MHYFTIKDIENLCGIKAHTIRIWEQRNLISASKRKESTHRIYDNDDLKQLLRIAFLYHNGWKISKISRLQEDDMLHEVRNTVISPHIYPLQVLRLIEAAVDFNEANFNLLLEEMMVKIGFEPCIVEVCYPFLQRIGVLWITNNVLPAQEHFSSYLIQNKIIAQTDKLTPIFHIPQILLFTPQGEFHELPLLFINYLLKKYGKSVLYVGSNIHLQEVQAFAGSSIKYLFLHLITNFTGMSADDYFEELCRTFPDKIILASGTITHQVQKSFHNLRLLTTDALLYNFVQNDI